MSELDFSAIQPHTTVSTPGRLRQAREAAGLHIAVLATMLKVPVRKLDALENGRFDELPDITFARALASSACRHLKIDPEPVLAELPGARPATLVQMAGDDKPAFRPAGHSVWTSLEAPALLRRPSSWLALGLLVVATTVYFWPAPQPAPDAAQSDPVAPVVRPADPVAVDSVPPQTPAVVPEVTTQSLPSSPSAPATASDPVAPAQPTAPVQIAPAEVSLPEVAGNDLLVIVGTGESWLEVVDAQGQVLLRRMLRSGEVHRFNTQPPYRVLLGNADAAQVAVRGKAFDTAPFARNSVARFEVK